jgi:DNA-binding Lrp family transcriptional regulator
MHQSKRASAKDSLRPRFDAIDRRILKQLVEDGRMSNLEVAEKGRPVADAVQPSHPATRGRRRHRRLRG